MTDTDLHTASTAPTTGPVAGQPQHIPPVNGAAAAVQDSGPVDFDLDAIPDRADIAPARVRIGGQVWEIAAPDAGTVMEIEQVRSTEAALTLLFDDQWPKVRPLLEGRDPEVLIELMRELSDRFGLSEQAMRERTAPNRAERRRRMRALPR